MAYPNPFDPQRTATRPNPPRFGLRLAWVFAKIGLGCLLLTAIAARTLLYWDASGREPVADLAFERTEDGYRIWWSSERGMTEAEVRRLVDPYLTGQRLPISGECQIWRASLRVGFRLGKPIGPPAYKRTIVGVRISGNQGLEYFDWPEGPTPRDDLGATVAEMEAQFKETNRELAEKLRELASTRSVDAPAPVDMETELPALVEAIAQRLDAESMGDAASAVRAGGTDSTRWHSGGVALAMAPLVPALVIISLFVWFWISTRRRLARLRDELLLRPIPVGRPGNAEEEGR